MDNLNDAGFDEQIFHIFGVDGVDVDRLWNVTAGYCNDDDFSGELVVFEKDAREEGAREFDVLLRYASTQGVSIICFEEERPSHLHIVLHEFGSIGDAKLAFGLMQALREMCPDCEIFYNGTYKEGQFALNKENFDDIVTVCMRNFMQLIDSAHDGEHVGVPGFYHNFIAPSGEDFPELDLADLTMQAMSGFIGLQWDYGDYVDASPARVTNPEGEEYTMCFLTNKVDTFVPVCQHVGLSYGKDKVKDIPTYLFVEKMDGHPCFHPVDAMQFVLDAMSQKEWKEICESFEV